MMLLRVLALCLVFVAASAAPAHAGFVGVAIGAIATGIKGVLAAGGIGALLLKGVASFALRFGLSLLQQAIRKEPPQPGVKLQIEVGDDEPIGFILLPYATAGTRKYVGSWGNAGKTPNAYLTDVVQVGDVPAPGQPALWVNGQKCTVLWNAVPTEQGYPVEEFRKNGVDYLWVRYRDGTQAATDGFLLAKFGAHADRPWKSDMIGRGCPYFTVTSRFNRDLFPGQMQWLFEPPSIPLYDVRKDTTAGGSGPHRWNNPATWEPTDNPIVGAYNVVRGIYHGVPGGEWVFGGQNLAAFRLPASNWMAAANACDALVPLDGGGQEKAFRGGYEVRGDMEPLAVVEELLKACNGRFAEVGGIFKVLVGTPAAAVYSFTDADIVITKGQSFRPFPGLDQTVNGIEATYPEPAEAWSTKNAPARYSAELEQADGNRRLPTAVQLPAAPFAIQVQRIIQAMLLEERRFRVHSFCLPPEAWLLEPNDVVSWTSARNGYENKKFIVVSIEGEPTVNQIVLLKEIDPADHDWNPATDQQPVSVGPLGPILPTAQVMTGWQVEGAYLADADGEPRRPSVRVTYDGDNDDVRAVRVQVRLAAAGDLQFDGEQPYGAPTDDPKSVILNGAFLPATAYQARGIFVPYSGRETEWSGWMPVTTPDVRFGAADLYDGIIGFDQLGEELEALIAWINADLGGQVGDNAAAILANAQAILDEAQVRADAIAQEVADRAAAIAAEAAARAAAIAQEITDREAGDLAEAGARAAGLLAEATARQAEIGTERTQRIADATAGAANLRNLAETVAAVSLRSIEIGVIGEKNRTEAFREIALSEDRSRAGYTEAITVAVGPGSAVASRFTSIEAQAGTIAGDLTAAIERLDLAIVEGDQAEASSRQSLAAQLRGSYEGGDASLITSGLLYQQRQTVVSELQALSIALSLVSAGVGEQFDSRALWHFTYGAEDFTGNGSAPTASGGFLRPANGSDPYVISPNALAITNNEYSQVKLRLKKIGSPTWRGWVWWNRPDDVSWSTDRRVALAEPDWDANGESVATWTMGWSGIIDQIRVEMTAASSNSDRVEFDWIAVGRPAPGASSADIARLDQALASGLIAEAEARELISVTLVGQEDPTGLTLPTLTGGIVYDERVARASGDEALTTLVQGVQAELDDVSGGIDTLAAAQLTLTGRVDTAEGQIAINAAAIVDVVADLAGKVDSAVTDQLAADIAELGGGQGIRATAQAVRALRSEIGAVALANVELGLFGEQNRARLAGAIVEASQTLNTRIDATDSGLALLGQAVTAIQVQLPGFAGATALSSLEGRVTVTEGSITSQGSAITSLGAEIDALEGVVDTKASTTALSTLDTRVAATETGLTAVSSDLVSLGAVVDGKASVGALSALDTRVTVTEGDIEAIGSDVTAIELALPGKASVAALNALDARVTDSESELASTVSALTQLETGLDALSGVVDTKATVTALNLLDARVVVNEGQIGALTTAVTSLDAELDGKASTSVTDALASQITDLGSVGVRTLAESVRSVRAGLGAVALANIETGFFDERNRAALGNAIANVDQSLTGRIDATDSGLTLLGQAVTAIQVALPGLASTTAVQALEGRVTVNEAGIVSQSSAITSLQSDLAALDTEVDTKASATALGALDTRVTSAEGTISAQGTAITAINADLDTLEGALAGKASVSALTALDGRVTTVEGGLSGLSSAVTALDAEIDDKASASVVSALSAEVTEIDGIVSAQAGALQTLRAALGGDTAEIRVKMEAVAGPAGYARYGIQAATSGGAFRSASLFLDAPTASGQPTRVVVMADQFIVTDGASADNPFIIQDNTVYLANGRIGDLVFDKLRSADGKMVLSGMGGTYIDMFGPS